MLNHKMSMNVKLKNLFLSNSYLSKWNQNVNFGIFSLQVFLFQKSAVYKCNMVGKPVIISRVVDSMTANLRPTRAEATDVANAVLDGTYDTFKHHFFVSL